MTGGLAPRQTRLRITAARVYQAIGWPGLAGLVALVLSGLVSWDAWVDSRDAEAALVELDSAEVRLARAPMPADRPAVAPEAGLPAAEHVPTLLKRMARAAVAEGLGWPQAEYRYLPASSDLPASVEVRCALKGPYPRIRRFLSVSLRDIPSATLRELQISRASVEVADVEARMVVSIYVADGVAATSVLPAALGVTPGASGASP